MERSFPAEKFKPALCVANRHFNQRIQKIEKTSGSDAPIPRLMPLNLRLFQTSRTDDDLVAFPEPMCDLVVFIQRYLVVGVRVTENAPTREADRLAHTPSFPAALLMSDDSEVRIFNRDLADQLACAIVTVSSNDNFRVETPTS